MPPTPMDRAISRAAALVILAGSADGQPSTVPFPAQFELSSLLPANGGDGSDGFVINGIDPLTYSCNSVSGAGDINGDGIDDVIIGAYRAESQGSNNSGQSFVVFGGANVGSSGVVELWSLNGANGFVVNGANSFDYSGDSVSGAGDLNGDGIDDVIIGAYRASPLGATSAGQSYVVFGGASVGAPGVVELSSLDGTIGFAMNGANSFDHSGVSVSQAGDLNGDGIADLILGASGAQPSAKVGAGASYIVFGRDVFDIGDFLPSFLLSDLDGNNGFALHGVDAFDSSGASVSAAGDINGDGLDDVIIGAHRGDPNGLNNAGESYIVFGSALATPPVFELSTLNGANGFVINGIDAFMYSCNSVSCAGDVNGDGIDDVIVGAYRADPLGANNSGQSFVIFGGASVGASGAVELSSLDGTNGFAMNGANSFDYSGISVSGAGDLNGDGIDDVIIGAYRADPGGRNGAGQGYIVFGRDTTSGANFPASLNLSTLNGTDGFIINGIDPGDNSFETISAAGDINADGVGDVIIGARFGDPNAVNNAGECYILFGRNVSTLCEGDANADGVVDFGDITDVLGNWLNDYSPGTGLGDANGDGVVDFGDITSVLGNWLQVCS